MSKFSKLVKALRLILAKPYLLNNIINHDENYKEKVIKNYKLNDGMPQVDITTLFPEFSETINPYAFLDGGSSPLDLAMLKALVKKYHVKTYLEIGTWRGESVANIADSVDECYTINLPDEEIMKIFPNSNYVSSHRFFSDNLEKVKHISAHSHNFDFKSLKQTFDMVFIDGDHHYDSVKKDTDSVFETINPEKSIMVWHDYTFYPETIRWEVLCGILDGLPKDYHRFLYHVSNTNCAVFIPHELEVKPLVPYEMPNKKFEISIRAQKL